MYAPAPAGSSTEHVFSLLGGHYFTERTGTERNSSVTLFYGTDTTAKYFAIKLPTVVLAFPVSKGLYILAGV